MLKVVIRLLCFFICLLLHKPENEILSSDKSLNTKYLIVMLTILSEIELWIMLPIFRFCLFVT